MPRKSKKDAPRRSPPTAEEVQDLLSYLAVPRFRPGSIEGIREALDKCTSRDQAHTLLECFTPDQLRRFAKQEHVHSTRKSKAALIDAICRKCVGLRLDFEAIDLAILNSRSGRLTERSTHKPAPEYGGDDLVVTAVVAMTRKLLSKGAITPDDLF